MGDKFQNKYRIKSHRMPGWDYSGDGYYFITLVTQNRECNLGEIVDEIMILSDFGQIVKNEWDKSFNMRDELFLDEFIIMPNHLHAIIILKTTKIEKINDTHGLYGLHVVDTHGRAYLQTTEQTEKKLPFIRKSKSISSFIGGFKSAINSKIDNFIDKNNLNILKYNKNNHFFQPNYHDHIIRNINKYQRIKNYIINNPLKWNDDKFNPNNIKQVK